MVEGARLESVYTGNRIVGSNPTFTASNCFFLLWKQNPFQHGRFAPHISSLIPKNRHQSGPLIQMRHHGLNANPVAAEPDEYCAQRPLRR